MKPFAWWNPRGGIHPLILDYQKEDMRADRAVEYSVPLFRLPDEDERPSPWDSGVLTLRDENGRRLTADEIKALPGDTLLTVTVKNG